MKKEEIETALKEKGIKFNTVTVFLEEDNTEKTATFFLRKPDKTVRGLIGRIAQKDGLQAVYAAIKNLEIKDVGGDDVEILMKNDYALASAEEAVVSMLEVQKAILKKN